ncbi:hypothetical protein BY996DRAFT_6455765 [Phakopsora pachyrhizi]|nr:hypothetical protein BY996DRAFT_6455765 [Phakopsora pachyrhizi]
MSAISQVSDLKLIATSPKLSKCPSSSQEPARAQIGHTEPARAPTRPNQACHDPEKPEQAYQDGMARVINTLTMTPQPSIQRSINKKSSLFVPDHCHHLSSSMDLTLIKLYCWSLLLLELYSQNNLYLKKNYRESGVISKDLWKE